MRYDATIVGDGPAGLIAAIILARAGMHVLVVGQVRQSVRRPGETLVGSGQRLLRHLGLPLLVANGPHRPLTGIASAWNRQGLVETDYLASPDGHSWLIERNVFEEALTQAAIEAGAAITRSVKSVPESRGATWELEVSGRVLKTDFLIDATGRAARLARRLGARPAASNDAIAWWSVARGEAPNRLWRPMIERTANGWWFAVALDKTRTYAAFHSNEALSDIPDRDLLWHRRLAGTKWIGGYLSSASRFGRIRGCPAGDGRLERPCGERWAACGDAAMALDPLSSQGLLSAMAGGDMLARSLTATGMSRSAALTDYATRINEIWSIYATRRKTLMAA